MRRGGSHLDLRSRRIRSPAMSIKSEVYGGTWKKSTNQAKVRKGNVEESGDGGNRDGKERRGEE